MNDIYDLYRNTKKFPARSEQREARRLGLALAREREGLDGSGATHDSLTRAAPPCGGTEPAWSEPEASGAQAGDPIGGAQAPQPDEAPD